MEITKSNVNSRDKVQIHDQKLKLVNMACATLIHEPKYYTSSNDEKSAICALISRVASGDPEFIFKLALYIRDDLNIRSTANFFLAVAANIKECQPHFKKYFGAIVRLPSDMLEVVTLYTLLPDRYLVGQSIPTCLRTAVTKKFPSFDVYQLAKYNKERAQKRKNKKAENNQSMDLIAPVARVAPVKDSTRSSVLTLKQLIRKVHLAQPAEQVMSIVGKKYPSTAEAFQKSGMTGEWIEEKAGKRMKLPTPETWETLLSAKGNRHTTWQELIDHKKLPFMAMLRNLRNMIITGISPEHHEYVLSKLTDERSVTSSRQLPWRFLSAYQAIDVDLEQMMNDILDHDGSEHKLVQVKVKGKKGAQMGQTRTIKKRVIIPVHMPDHPLLQRYREAIDTAIRLSTLHNLKTIEGTSVVFCDVSGSMGCPCSTRGNFGSIQSVKEIAMLLGLMLQECCEECDFRIFSSPGTSKRCDVAVPLIPNTILENIKRVQSYESQLGGGTDFPFDYLEDLIAKKKHMDNFIILSDMMIAPGHQEMGYGSKNTVTSILQRYRQRVNPNLLFVTIDLYGRGSSLVEINQENPLNVLITGFSDNILRFISERGSSKQLEHIETIDERKGLNKTPEMKA